VWGWACVWVGDVATGDGSGMWEVPGGVWYPITYTLGVADPGNGRW